MGARRKFAGWRIPIHPAALTASGTLASASSILRARWISAGFGGGDLFWCNLNLAGYIAAIHDQHGNEESKAYAFEELIAEIGNCLICAAVGANCRLCRSGHVRDVFLLDGCCGVVRQLS